MLFFFFCGAFMDSGELCQYWWGCRNQSILHLRSESIAYQSSLHLFSARSSPLIRLVEPGRSWAKTGEILSALEASTEINEPWMFKDPCRLLSRSSDPIDCSRWGRDQSGWRLLGRRASSSRVGGIVACRQPSVSASVQFSRWLITAASSSAEVRQHRWVAYSLCDVTFSCVIGSGANGWLILWAAGWPPDFQMAIGRKRSDSENYSCLCELRFSGIFWQVNV